MALRISPFLLRFLVVGALAHAFVGASLLPDAPVPLGVKIAAGLYLAMSCLLIPRGMWSGATAGPADDRVKWAALSAMGFFSSLFVLTMLRAVVLLIAVAVAWAGVDVPIDEWRGPSALAVPVLAVLTTLRGLYNARRRAPLKKVTVPITGLPAALEGLTIVQLSDIHVGPTIKRGYVQAIVRAANGVGADIIAITGDLVDGSVARLAPHVEPLSALQARHGVYVVTGNHEYYAGASAWVAEFRRLGLQVLLNQHVVIDHAGEHVVLAGVTDFTAGVYDPAQASDAAQALVGAPTHAGLRLLLAHQPASAPAAAPLGFDLQLSGHTHGGQFLPWGLFVRLQQPFTAGLRKCGAMWVYISRGTGYWGPPKRLGAPSEITVLRLVRA